MLKVKVSEDCTLCVAANTTRANTGCVLEDSSNASVNYSGACASIAAEVVGCTTCPGDGDMNGTVTLNELVTAITIMDNHGFADIPSTDSDYNPCYDWDGNGTWTLNDSVTFITVMDNNGFADLVCP